MTGSSGRNHQLELTISGMTCASCAARVERKLNQLDGVRASINYATEKARVNYADGVTPEDLLATVAGTGYTADDGRRWHQRRRRAVLGRSRASHGHRHRCRYRGQRPHPGPR